MKIDEGQKFHQALSYRKDNYIYYTIVINRTIVFKISWGKLTFNHCITQLYEEKVKGIILTGKLKTSLINHCDPRLKQ